MNIAIIGGGPAGLYFAGLCTKYNIKYTLFEATDKLGGQLVHLYPEKIITNIPGIEAITATSYIDDLSTKLNLTNIILNNKLESLESLKTAYTHIIIATGLGNYQPRKLGLEGEENYNVLYSLRDYNFLKNKKVVIFGGGDSALDWAKQLSEISKVSLVHRRDEFRGNAKTLNNCELDLYLSYIPVKINKDVISIESVKTKEIIDLNYDYILVNFGQIINKIIFEETNNVYYIGDVTGTRTIAGCIFQAEKLFKEITHE